MGSVKAEMVSSLINVNQNRHLLCCSAKNCDKYMLLGNRLQPDWSRFFLMALLETHCILQTGIPTGIEVAGYLHTYLVKYDNLFATVAISIALVIHITSLSENYDFSFLASSMHQALSKMTPKIKSKNLNGHAF